MPAPTPGGGRASIRGRRDPVVRARAACNGASSDHGRFTFAVSGGHTPWAMFAELANEDVPWDKVVIFQVDERVAPDGDPDRNLTHLRDAAWARRAGRGRSRCR